ncbi:hypothetical protein QYF61_009496 [Mycteria americana]|uniref:Uncharacterized protein n=1 Tax=Mycteria americana TaxID=33587 RepID=A0AAN7NMU4_MYCAM|nr:hypothetical protein QYF61_009496 [Mycteria americana]
MQNSSENDPLQHPRLETDWQGSSSVEKAWGWLEYGSWFWAPQCKQDISELECVQQGASKMVAGWSMCCPREDTALVGPNSSLPVPMRRRLSGRQSQALHGGGWWQNERQRAYVETREAKLDI